MEMVSESEMKKIIYELAQGREVVNQLKNLIGPTAPKQTCELLLQKIHASMDKALDSLNWTSLLQQDPSPVVALVQSPEPCDDVTPKRKYAMEDQSRPKENVSKKRKKMPRWSEQVRVCSSGTGLEGPLDDGYSWRKYGQKDILGASHPRAYYRCTHRHTRGCAATKQVQRSDEDSSIIEVSYRGKHSCIEVLDNSALPAVSPVELADPKEIISTLQQQLKEKQKIEQENKPVNNLGVQGLKVETEAMDPKVERFPSFTFPSTPIQPENSLWERLEEDHIILGGYTPPFIPSPATSESNYFSSSSCQMNPYGLEPDLADIISTPTSVTNSPFDWDFPSEVDFDPNLALENLEYFS